MWGWLLILAVLGAPLTLVLHELSHAVATWATGGKVTLFRPWPHRHEGRFYFGRMMREGGQDLAVHAAPLAKATGLLLVWALLALCWLPLLCLWAWELVDLAWWWRGWIWKPYTDGGKARALLRGDTT